MEWKSLEDEIYREYRFPGNEYVRIDFPVKLNVSASEGHRILDSAGKSHYVHSGWIHLVWQVKEGRDPFAF